jgi:hypothetical protein
VGVARKVAAALIVVLSLWELIAWGFWGLLILSFSRGLYGGAEVSSTGRQVVLALLILLLAVLNPVTAIGLLARGTIFTWTLVVGVVAADIVAYAFFFGGGPRTWQEVVAPIVAAALLIVAFPRPLRADA